MNARARVLSAMFCIGAVAVAAQVLFTREALVAFYGNELGIGSILAGWLAGIGCGALAHRALRGRIADEAAIRAWLGGLLVLMAVSLPLQVLAIRSIRLALRVPAGQYASFGAVLGSSALVFLPASFAVGLFFPLACGLLAAGRSDSAAAARAAGLAYALESLGSALGGAALTYVLVAAMSPARILCLASALAAAGAAAVLPRRSGRLAAAAAALALTAAGLLNPAALQRAEASAVRARWRAFGALGAAAGQPDARLVASRDTIYQNLAVIESHGQFTLYANGQVASVFPDPYGYEYAVHFIMAQKPDAQSVLLLGGNPAGDVPELLKYPLKRLVFVELDPGAGAVIRAAVAREYDRALADPRVRCMAGDAPRFARRCRERFDVVIVNGPAPTTTSANRFYTVEFYGDLRRLLAPRGFMFTQVASAERLRSEATDLGASIFKTLRQVFPVVLATAEPTNRFFAGEPDSGLTFDRQTLYGRSAGARIPAVAYQPEYLLGADEIAEDKTRYVAQRFEESPAPVNEALRPVACYYSLQLWSRFSGSRVGGALRALSAVSLSRLAAGCAAAALVVLLGGAGARARTAKLPPFPQSDGLLPAARWSTAMIGMLLATTGFLGMAAVIVMLFVFQGLYGYVYSRLGLIVAAFMLGLVLGAPAGRGLAGGRPGRAWAALAGAELALGGIMLALPAVAAAGLARGADVGELPEIAIYLMVMATGFAVGAEFPLGNALFCRAGGTAAAAAALAQAADHFGAAAGALVAGVFLVPVLGTGDACAALALVKGVGLACLASAWAVRSTGRG